MASRSRMAWNVFLGLAIGCCAAAGMGQAAQGAPIQITIGTDHLEFVAGTVVELHIEVKNISDHQIPYFPPSSLNGRAAGCCNFYIRAEDGSIPRSIPLPGVGQNINHDITGETLQPGQTVVDAGNVGEWYDLSAPGRYRIYAFQGRGKDMIRSNEVTVTVLPKQQSAPQ